ncbi:MAG: polysaccharide deacetylase family protein [Candidatus Heimdallarchaeaceae archaeon]
MVYIFVCIDFDRDAAFPFKNRKYAVSNPIKLQNEPSSINKNNALSIEGTKRAFSPLMSFLTENEIPTTFYFEGRTIQYYVQQSPEVIETLQQPLFEFGNHGYDHEDFLGIETNEPLTKTEEYLCIRNSKEEIEKTFNKKIIGFRAPYMRLSEHTLQILVDLNYKYDSSTYIESIKAITPFLKYKKLWEFPVIKTPKKSSMNGMYTYLWPMFEGSRRGEEIIHNYKTLIHNSDSNSSYISINLHSWHFAYNIKQNKYLSEKEININIKLFQNVLFALQDIDDVIFSTPRKYLQMKNKA